MGDLIELVMVVGKGVQSVAEADTAFENLTNLQEKVQTIVAKLSNMKSMIDNSKDTLQRYA